MLLTRQKEASSCLLEFSPNPRSKRNLIDLSTLQNNYKNLHLRARGLHALTRSLHLLLLLYHVKVALLHQQLKQSWIATRIVYFSSIMQP
jgi:hypothetical protein